MDRSLAALVIVVLAAVCAPAAHATEASLAPVGNDSALSAYGGWVAWSELQPDGRWALAVWHDGAKSRPPVRGRAVPFDVDVGSDARGRVVATYSRCATEPMFQGVPGYPSPNGLPRWSRGTGCALRVLDLATGQETPLRLARPHGASDTTPSMWRGRVAFARLDRGAVVAQVLLYDPATRRLRRLRHGAVMRGGEGEVQQLDLGARAVAFVWDVRGARVIGAIDGWELRADRLSDRASRIFGSGYSSGACGARYPVSPAVVGDAVWFDEVRYQCDTPHTTPVVGDLRTGRYGRGAEIGPDPAWQLAWDGATLYALRGPRSANDGSSDAPCVGSQAPCRLTALDRPAAPRADRRAHSPFF